MTAWQPHVTVATVIASGGRYLLVEERDKHSGELVFNQPAGHLEQGETLAAAASTEGAAYPVGTVVQLVPQEAMVKRYEGFSPETADWEFFAIDVVDGRTVIKERGTTQIRNIAGGCADCHAPARAFDFVCAEGHGCEPLPGFVVNKAPKKVAKDKRCQ